MEKIILGLPKDRVFLAPWTGEWEQEYKSEVRRKGLIHFLFNLQNLFHGSNR